MSGHTTCVAPPCAMNAIHRVWKTLPVPTGLRSSLFNVRRACWRTLRAPVGIAYRIHEDREVARIRAMLGRVPFADVVTVIATYRRAEGLTAAVRSALDQTVTDHLVVVVDDGGGLPVLPDDERLLAISLARNYGCLGMVRNVGLRVTRSRYIAFLDDDNTWTPQHLEVSLAAHRDDVEVTYTALRRTRPDGTTQDVLSIPFDRATLRSGNPADSNALVFRRRPDVMFSRIPRLKEDWLLVRRLDRRGRRIVHVPVPTVHYLLNPDSYFTDWTRRGELGSEARAC